MHVYTGVDCKQCKKFVALRESLPGVEDRALSGEYRLVCTDGHQNTYAAAEFYTLESGVPYALPPPPKSHDGRVWKPFSIVLVVVLLFLLAWLTSLVFVK